MALAPKSDFQAHVFKAQGSRLLQKKQYPRALFFYNLSLTFAETNLQKSWIFANRSLVYLKLEQYSNCLHNIQLARDYGYKAEKLPKLKEREEVCKKALRSQKPDDNPWNFFKLSLPPNPKIPFIANCLEIRKSQMFGRGIYTNEDLNPGDVIAVEEAFMAYQTRDVMKIVRCTNCFVSNNMDLRPCSGICNNAMFCSKKCEKAAKLWHEHDPMNEYTDEVSFVDMARDLFAKALSFAGGDIEKLRQILHSKEQFSVFDFDFSDPNDPQRSFKLLQALCGLHVVQDSFKYFKIMYKVAVKALSDRCFSSLTKDQSKHHDMIDFICLLLLVTDSNQQSFGQLTFNELKKIQNMFAKTGGVGFFPFFSLLNHSCDPNATHVMIDNKLAIVVLHPIPAGSQIFVSYEHVSYFFTPIRHDRQVFLTRCGINCQCGACKNPDKFRPYEISHHFTHEEIKDACSLTQTPSQAVAIIKKFFKVLKESPRKCSMPLFLVCFQLRSLASFAMLQVADFTLSIFDAK